VNLLQAVSLLVTLKRQVATRFAKSLRREDLENHIIFYRLQNLGNFENDKVKEYGFDSNRLRPVLHHYLMERGIHAKFHFFIAGKDSLLNQLKFPDSLVRNKSVVTKAFPTYKWWDLKDQYVRAIFENPVAYVMGKMK